jgi:hypothetical protein
MKFLSIEFCAGFLFHYKEAIDDLDRIRVYDCSFEVTPSLRHGWKAVLLTMRG